MANITNALDSRAYGAGGSGADHDGSTTGNAGDGANGIIVVEEYS